MLETYAILAIFMLGFWVISIPLGKVSFIDSLWGLGFVISAWAAFYTTSNGSFDFTQLAENQMAILILTSLWGGRLCIYLLNRFLKDGEDRRYINMTKGKEGVARHFFTLWFVFGLQSVLIILIGLPVVRTMLGGGTALNAIAYIGIGLWVIGAVFEWIGDWQLSRFKANPDNTGKVMDKGLWAWTRHPNYFGDACLWWGLWVISQDLYTIWAPALMTYLLMKWSGVPLLEHSLKKRRPGYEDYIARTSGFFPLPPKKSATTEAAE